MLKFITTLADRWILLFRDERQIEEVTTTVTFTHEPCRHSTGWYGAIPFMIFYRRIFSCSNCGRMLYGKELKEFEKRLKVMKA